MNWASIASISIGVIGLALFIAILVSDLRRSRRARRAGLGALVGIEIFILLDGHDDWMKATVLAFDRPFFLLQDLRPNMAEPNGQTVWINVAEIKRFMSP